MFCHPTPAPPLGDGRGVKLVVFLRQALPSPRRWEGSEVSGFLPSGAPLPSQGRGWGGVSPPVRRSLPIWGRVREGLPFRSGEFEILITDGCGFLRPLRGTSEQVEFKSTTTKKSLPRLEETWKRVSFPPHYSSYPFIHPSLW